MSAISSSNYFPTGSTDSGTEAFGASASLPAFAGGREDRSRSNAEHRFAETVKVLPKKTTRDEMERLWRTARGFDSKLSRTIASRDQAMLKLCGGAAGIGNCSQNLKI
jgi:hypothetical protein